MLAFVFWLTYAIGTPLQDWLDGLLGQFGDGVRGVLPQAAPWLADLLADGLIGGVGMVITFLPILVIFFAVLGFSGRHRLYGARGLHHRPVYARDGSPRQELYAAAVGVWLQRARDSGIAHHRDEARASAHDYAGPADSLHGADGRYCCADVRFLRIVSGGWVAWGLVTVNLLVLVAIGVVANKLVLKGEQAMFIMELPLYHLPNPRTIGLYVWQNVVAFLHKAGTVILVASIVVWMLSYFPANGDLTQSFLAQIGRAMAPLGRLMGLPWPMMISLLTSFVAKENTIATLSVLYGDFETVLPTLITVPAALGFLVVQMLFIPCIATVSAIRQETQSLKWTGCEPGDAARDLPGRRDCGLPGRHAAGGRVRMLRQLLTLIAENEHRTPQDLAKALAVPDALVSQMVEQLARSGYLVDSQTCGDGCGECSLKSACGSENFRRFAVLVADGEGAGVLWRSRESMHSVGG